MRGEEPAVGLARLAGEGLDRPDFAADADSVLKNFVPGGKGNMREYVFKVFREAETVRCRGQQAKDRIEDAFDGDRLAIGRAQACDDYWCNIRRANVRSPIMERKGVSAIAAAEGVIVGKEPVAPNRRTRARTSRHGIQADIVTAPYLLKLRPWTIDKTRLIVKPSEIKRSVGDPSD
jgi:hypothetical protein